MEPRLVSEGGEMAGVLAFVASGLGAAVVPAIALPRDGSLVGIPFDRLDHAPHRGAGPAGDRTLARPARALADQLVAGPPRPGRATPPCRLARKTLDEGTTARGPARAHGPAPPGPAGGTVARRARSHGRRRIRSEGFRLRSWTALRTTTLPRPRPRAGSRHLTTCPGPWPTCGPRAGSRSPWPRRCGATPPRPSPPASRSSPASSASRTRSCPSSRTPSWPATTSSSWASGARPRRGSSAPWSGCSTSGCPSWPAPRSTTTPTTPSRASPSTWSTSSATTRRSPGCTARSATARSWPPRTRPSPTSSARWTRSRSPRAATSATSWRCTTA